MKFETEHGCVVSEMATAYGSALGLDYTGLLLALLVTQIVAFTCALICAKLSGKYPTERLIGVCIVAYIGIALFAIQLDKQWEFWTLAVLVGMFQGAIQALARSYFAKIIPAENPDISSTFLPCGAYPVHPVKLLILLPNQVSTD